VHAHAGAASKDARAAPNSRRLSGVIYASSPLP
jgi:hypothetical protein